MMKQGEQALDFELADQNEKIVKLSDFLGKKVVLYFYPKDDTPGCTVEACEFRDVYDYILATGSVVIGVSPDSSASHIKFATKHNLPFHLLSDTEHKLAEAYGVWAEKTMFGKKYFGIVRTTLIIDEKGKIMQVFPKVSPAGHAEEILQVLKNK
ncbi:MAG: thioredoxin-dependent thiol peroxidase [Clostridia bacterium]